MITPAQIKKRKNLPNLLLISGSGRNCGKTSLACRVIEHLASSTEIIALKISPHFHRLSAKQVLLYSDEQINIYLETNPYSGKDSARMLEAGASRSIYIQCEDKYIEKAWQNLSELIPVNDPIVCESGSLATVFKPGLHLLVEGEEPDKLKSSYAKNKPLADRIVRFNGENFTPGADELFLNGKEWKLKQNKDDKFRRSA